MRVIFKLIKSLMADIAKRDEPRMGTLDYTTGKVTW